MNNVDTETMCMLARRELGHRSDEAAVAWAYSKLERGDETPSVLMLGSLSPPFNSWEVERLLRAALSDLRLRVPSKREILMSYAQEIASRIVQQPEMPVPELEMLVKDLNDVCIALDYPKELIEWVGHHDDAPPWSNYPGPEEWRRQVLEDARGLSRIGGAA